MSSKLTFSCYPPVTIHFKEEPAKPGLRIHRAPDEAGTGPLSSSIQQSVLKIHSVATEALAPKRGFVVHPRPLQAENESDLDPYSSDVEGEEDVARPADLLVVGNHSVVEASLDDYADFYDPEAATGVVTPRGTLKQTQVSSMNVEGDGTLKNGKTALLPVRPKLEEDLFSSTESNPSSTDEPSLQLPPPSYFDDALSVYNIPTTAPSAPSAPPPLPMINFETLSPVVKRTVFIHDSQQPFLDVEHERDVVAVRIGIDEVSGKSVYQYARILESTSQGIVFTFDFGPEASRESTFVDRFQDSHPKIYKALDKVGTLVDGAARALSDKWARSVNVIANELEEPGILDELGDRVSAWFDKREREQARQAEALRAKRLQQKPVAR